MLGEDSGPAPDDIEPDETELEEAEPIDEPDRTVTRLAGAKASFEDFIADITPFFYRHAITYVDVGAFDGSVFAKLQESGLAIREAHLIEPNPESFALLQASVTSARATQSVHLYHMAIGGAESTVRMKKAHSMSRVLEKSDEEDTVAAESSTSFTVKCSPLDDMAHLFFNRHISILKVDVEGYEKHVLDGAAQLFGEQRVDVLYIEAGADPDAEQQCYYRIIDDEMIRHGYRLFRIYEQTHEWMSDSPSLRRMNLCYMSTRFANANPFRLTLDLFDARESNKSLSRRVSKLEERLSVNTAKRLAIVEKKHLVDQKLAESQAAARQLAENLQASKAEARQLTEDLQASKAEARQLAENLQASKTEARQLTEDLQASKAEAQRLTENFHAREAEAQHLTEQLEQAHQQLEEARVTLTERDAAATLLHQDLQRARAAVAEREAAVTKLAEELESVRSQTVELRLQSERDIAQREQALIELSDTMGQLSRELDKARVETTARGASLQNLRAQSAQERRRLQREIESLREQIASRDAVIEARGRELADLRKVTARLAAIEASTSWRITAPLRALKGGARTPPQTPSLTPQPNTAAVAQSPPEAEPTPISTPVAPGPAPTRPKPRRATPSAASPSDTAVKALEEKLWGGFSKRALMELEAVKANGDPQQAADAAWALGGWYAAEGDFERGRDNARLSQRAKGANLPRVLLEAFCLVRLGDFAAARQLLTPVAARHPQNPHVLFALANANASSGYDPAADQARLAMINTVYLDAGLAPLKMKDALRGLNVDNLTTEPLAPAADTDRAKVSVILPIYNAVDTISFALDGLTTQTWRNLEIIAVDDCSTDRTAEILQGFAYRDPRIMILRQNANQGSYSARNLGLTVATGDFITVHDSNDWSHPQKIELQARHLLGNPHVIGNHSNLARVIDNMIFVGKFRRKDKIIDWNPSSFFFRRRLLDLVGGWDRVRISADAELIRRAREAATPGGEVGAIPETAPMAFAHDSAESLTKHSLTHGRTIYHGFRREYKEASSHWHCVASRAQLRLQGEARPFPAPGPILPDRDGNAEYDLLYVADFNLEDADTAATLGDIDAAAAAGRRVAVFHWRLYESSVTTPLSPSLRQRAQEGKLRIIAPGEQVTAHTVIVANPAALQNMIDLAPKASFSALHVLTDRGSPLTDVAAVRSTLTELFGTTGEWTPASAVAP